MGLTCPKCGTDNLMSAIFCRGCGDKLDLNAMKPEDLLKASVDAGKKKGATKGQKIFLSIFAGVLIVLILGAFCPTGAPKGEPIDVNSTPYKNYKTLKDQKGIASYEFTDEDATSILCKVLNINPEAEGDCVTTNVAVEFSSEDVIKITQTCKIYGILPMDNILKVGFTFNNGTIEFEPLAARIGFVPLLFGAETLVTDKVFPLMQNSNELKQLKSKVKKASTTDGSITLGR